MAIVTKRRRDWFRIIRDLMAAGVSMNCVGRTCGRDPRTVQQWADGADPKDSDAQVVLVLYARHCPRLYSEHVREFEIRVEG